MKLKSTIVVILALLGTSPLFAHGNLKFVNGKWFDGTTFVSRTMYSVEKTFRSDFDGEVQQTVDLAGKYVIPPFADAHNHALGNPATLSDDAKRFLRAGIFYVKNPNSVSSMTVEARSRLGTPEMPDAIFSGGGLTATGGHPIQIYDALGARGVIGGLTAAQLADEAYFVVDSKEDLQRKWPLITRAHPDFIKLYLDHSEEFEKRKSDPAFYGKRGLDPGLLKTIVDRAHGAGLTTTVHVTTAADFHNALLAGTDEIAHLPLGVIPAEDAALAAQKRTVVVTTTLSHRPTEGIDDPPALHRRNLEVLRSAGVPIVIGVDNGEKDAVDEALNVASMKLFTPLELLRLWTGATAREIFPQRKIGALEDGYEASFLALDANPLEDFSAVRRIALRVKQGHIVSIPPDKPAIADVILPLIRAKGVRAALREYDVLRQRKASDYDFSELQLNRVGYELLKEKSTDAAIEVFEHNTKLFPNSSNVWDSLGEACMIAGKRDQAIANYRKSLALNPHNANAAKMLEQLVGAPK